MSRRTPWELIARLLIRALARDELSDTDFVDVTERLRRHVERVDRRVRLLDAKRRQDEKRGEGPERRRAA